MKCDDIILTKTAKLTINEYQERILFWKSNLMKSQIND